VLPGVTRATVLELAAELGMPSEKTMLSIDDVFAAEEIFLTNSSWGLMPVIGIERTQIGSGTPGACFARLREAYRERVERETAMVNP
jgi:branched-subunit amino acid aminotransferase/4-amino-4-deoxychorismate lyase